MTEPRRPPGTFPVRNIDGELVAYCDLDTGQPVEHEDQGAVEEERSELVEVERGRFVPESEIESFRTHWAAMANRSNSIEHLADMIREHRERECFWCTN